MSEVLTKREQLLVAVKKVGVKEAVRRIVEDIEVPSWIRGIADREGVPIYARRVCDEEAAIPGPIRSIRPRRSGFGGSWCIRNQRARV